MVAPLAPSAEELEAFFAAFVGAYDSGHAVLLASMFEERAQVNDHRGRIAIYSAYDALFRRSTWRRMQLVRVQWRRAGDVVRAKGDVVVTTGWRDGREEVQRFQMDMDLARRDGRVVITRLAHAASMP